ncbi:MAG TPA: HD domain-containing phosphohydrolase [Thermoguttaceae bacterium]
MNDFIKRYSLLVITQTACLALGLWLEQCFVVSLALSESQNDKIASELVNNETVGGVSEGDATSSSLSAQNAEVSAIAVRAMAFVWIAVLQAIVAYLVLTRDQEETSRKHRKAEMVSLQQYNELLRTRDAVIFGLAKLTESRDPDTGNHLERIAIYSTRLAAAVRHYPQYHHQVTPSFVKLIGISSALHDIGKVGICDSILLKPGKLDRQERPLMQSHVAIGSKCIRQIESRLGCSNFLQMAREIALGHHERWDGMGYPKGLSGEEIPLAARIVAIADVYDALSTKRIYKEALPHEKCVEIIQEEAGRQFDPVLVEIFLKLESEFRDIARNYMDVCESQNAKPESAEETSDVAAEAEMSINDKLSAIQALLVQYTGDSPVTSAYPSDANSSSAPIRQPSDHTVSFTLENSPSDIELEPENVS